MKGLLPELSEEELGEADSWFGMADRRALKGFTRTLDSWRCRREVRCGLEKCFSSGIHGH